MDAAVILLLNLPHLQLNLPFSLAGLRFRSRGHCYHSGDGPDETTVLPRCFVRAIPTGLP